MHAHCTVVQKSCCGIVKLKNAHCECYKYRSLPACDTQADSQ